MVKESSMQTIESPNAPDIPGEGKPRRHAILGDRDLIGPPEGIHSAYENFLQGARLSNDGPYLGRRTIINGVAGPFVWETYGQVLKRVEAIASCLSRLGATRQECIGLFSINRPEWIIGEQACFRQNYITVPLYDTLGNDAIQYIIGQTEIRILLATADKAEKLLKMREHLPSLAKLILMDDVISDERVEELRAMAGEAVQLLTMRQAEEFGREGGLVDEDKAGLDDVFTICYTSGTTGLPKGVVLTHRNMLSDMQAAFEMMKHNKLVNVDKNDVHISYLPLAHVFERIIQLIVANKGGCVGFYQGDTLKLLDDVAELRPTVFVSVPRLFNRIYDKVWGGVKAKGGLAAYLFNTAYRQKMRGLRRGTVTHWLWDRLVFGTVRSKLGGRVRLMISGSAPISPDVMDFLRICFSANVYEGYGQTETAAGLTLTARGDCESGHVGAPFPCCEVKLVDLPEMNYTSADKPYPRGEVCVRGNQVFREYYKLPEKTAEALDADGWCRTGDVGQWDEKGRLQIIDRAKNIFKLAQGEYIAPERIENVYQKHELVAQAFVYGHSLQATLVGIIVPDEEALRKFAASHKMGDKSFKELCESEEVRQHVLRQLNAFGKQNDLKGFENVKNIRLEHEPFSVENDLLTPTFKIKRQPVQAKYQAVIDAMYAENA
ncbi:hypothetical protein SYNPS1DRAFT_12943 [Syncephalis pseudoplumigaleata]|uniref:Long-chain-fatty-acid--CoA ligase n=1 Tax=Syncephalis pseudoplumigaleata TaxID=1712513 RepID=A0A4P9Z5B0_9FUNG|nr:hypothetical protein SYNPS1DRAFT_12943 [Syncephalis pseudoplumigaleata]|eukprot:RKP27272.1 hypothetical protein SYNPS1DRAFT_12943 [Syncephalis pseudoplumigaleata]